MVGNHRKLCRWKPKHCKIFTETRVLSILKNQCFVPASIVLYTILFVHHYDKMIFYANTKKGKKLVLKLDVYK